MLMLTDTQIFHGSELVPWQSMMNTILPSEKELNALFRRHSGDPLRHGWRVRMHYRFGYYSSEKQYEAVVDRLVTEGCKWIDVGGGKLIFPNGHKLSRELAGRCKLLVGVDPSEDIDENTLVHQRVKSTIEDFRSEELFDLATFRMVAEHIQHPQPVVQSLARLIMPGGKVVIYTPNRWSPVSIAASLIPNKWHSFFTHLLWNTTAEDVFPTCYKMNTRNRLRTLFRDGGFAEVGFAYLSNCSTFARFRITCFGELCLWRVFRAFRITYPENELLGIYERL
jgi:2-polyprenyl-3-methyl-5-hydroxy-6-metoxy-1,4-benzoquinol methylase